MMWEFLIQKMKMYCSSVIFDATNELTYHQIIELAMVHGNRLKENLLPKSKCVILCDAGLNGAVSFLSCWYAGMIPVPVSMHYGERHCLKIIELIQPDLLITDNDKFQYPDFKYQLQKKEFGGEQKSKGDNEDLEDVAIIMFTSGTTGNPKGVLITEKGLKKNVIKISQHFNINSYDRIMIARPLYHCTVLTGELLLSLFNGVNIGFFDDKYSPNSMLEFATQNEISFLGGTPSLLNHFSTFIQRRNTKHLIKKVVLSGEIIKKNVTINIRKGFPDADIYCAYGMTEAAPRAAYLPPHKFDICPESAGIPFDGIQIKIVNEANLKLPVHASGMVMIKTPSVMKGYYKNDELTKETIIDGWLKTKDIGYQDENGYLYILSRADDMIIKGGMNIYPKEIENQIEELSQIKECSVYGIRADSGEKIAVDLALHEIMTKKELMLLLAGVLPSYQMPTEVNIVDSLPRNASGKIIRREKNDK